MNDVATLPLSIDRPHSGVGRLKGEIPPNGSAPDDVSSRDSLKQFGLPDATLKLTTTNLDPAGFDPEVYQGGPLRYSFGLNTPVQAPHLGSVDFTAGHMTKGDVDGLYDKAAQAGAVINQQDKAVDEQVAHSHQSQPPAVVDEDDDPEERDKLPELPSDEAVLADGLALGLGGYISYRMLRGLRRIYDKFKERVRGTSEEPKPEIKKGLAKKEISGDERIISDAHAAETDGTNALKLSGDTKTAGTNARETVEGAKEAVVLTRGALNGLKTLWEGSRLIRVAGALALGTVAVAGLVASSFVIGTLAVAAGVAIGVGAIVTYATGNLMKAAATGLKWGLEAALPSVAREEFAQAGRDFVKFDIGSGLKNAWRGIDDTVGLSAFGHLIGVVARAVGRGVVALATDPMGVVRSAENGAMMVMDAAQIGWYATVDGRTRTAALGEASDGLTGEHSQKRDLASALRTNTGATSALSDLAQRSGFGPLPFAGGIPSHPGITGPSANGDPDEDPAEEDEVGTRGGGSSGSRRPSRAYVSMPSGPAPING